MKLPPHRRERYLRDPLPVRLGGIASNLARVVSCADHSQSQSIISSLLYESKFFIEWTGPTTPVEQAEQLVELQNGLVGWEHRLAQLADPATQQALIQFARDWSDRLLTMSGLLSATSAS
jgi:hypothetical protein